MNWIHSFKKIFKIIKQLNPESYARSIGVSFGEGCRFVGRTDWGSESYLIQIGKHTEISFGCSFVTHDGSTWVFRNLEKYKNVSRFGKIEIGNDCFVGCRSIIMPGVTVGDYCIIGAGSLVNKDIPSGQVWAGVPAHYLMDTHDFAEKCLRESPNLHDRKYATKKDWVLDLIKEQEKRMCK